METLRGLQLESSMEMIDHLANSKLGKRLEEETLTLRNSRNTNEKAILNSKLKTIIEEETGLRITVHLTEGVNAYIYVPDVNRNNPMLDRMRQLYSTNLDAREFLKDKHFIDGTIDLKRGRVSGDYTKIATDMYVGDEFFKKTSPFTVREAVAIMLHEIGHDFGYLYMLGRCTLTNYVLNEGTRRLLTANTKEQRVIILEDIEDALDAKIPGKDMVAIKGRTEAAYRTMILDAEVQTRKEQMDMNVYNARSFEQMADQFAARHGYGRPLAVALDRIYRMGGSRDYMTPGMNTFLNVYSTLLVIGLSAINPAFLTFTVLSLLAIGNPLAETYDPPKKRIHKLQQQINNALRDKNLPDLRKKQMVEDYIAIEKVLGDMYNNIGPYDFIWARLLPFGRKSQSIIEINEELENMHNNDLFSAAAVMTT